MQLRVSIRKPIFSPPRSTPFTPPDFISDEISLGMPGRSAI
jgi:hypothetical protein